jgi:hypothetical protein
VKIRLNLSLGAPEHEWLENSFQFFNIFVTGKPEPMLAIETIAKVVDPIPVRHIGQAGRSGVRPKFSSEIWAGSAAEANHTVTNSNQSRESLSEAINTLRSIASRFSSDLVAAFQVVALIDNETVPSN